MSETELHIFPTLDRDKHSKELSYPIGAAALSRALHGVPQQDAISCYFTTGYPKYDNGKPQFHVMHVLYRKRERSFYDSKSAQERGVFDPRWSISIFAVPRQLRGTIKLLLLEQALPDLIRPWLIEKGNLTGQTGESVLMLKYIRADEIFKYTIRENIAPERSF